MDIESLIPKDVEDRDAYIKGVSYILDEDYWEEDCVNNSLYFQHMQLQYCIDTGDYNTLENRINSMLDGGGIKIKNS